MKINGGSILSQNTFQGSAKKLSGFNVNINRSDSVEISESTEQNRATTSGASLSASFATAAARIAKEAATEVQGLRKQQLALAEQADASIDTAERATLQRDIESIQTRIETVVNDAVDRAGNNVFTSRTYDIDENQVISLGNFSSLNDVTGVDVTTESGASSAVTALEEVVGSASDVVVATSATSTKAENILAEILAVDDTERSSDNDKLSSVEKAQQLANQVANDLRGRAAAGEATTLQNDLLLITGPGLL